MVNDLREAGKLGQLRWPELPELVLSEEKQNPHHHEGDSGRPVYP
jgi:hypothetical protein